MSKLLQFARDSNGVASQAALVSTDIFTAAILSGASQSFTVPSANNTYRCKLNYQATNNVWVAVNQTAAVPAGATFASSNSADVPNELYLMAGDVVNVLNNSGSTCNVTATLWAVS